MLNLQINFTFAGSMDNAMTLPMDVEELDAFLISGSSAFEVVEAVSVCFSLWQGKKNAIVELNVGGQPA